MVLESLLNFYQYVPFMKRKAIQQSSASGDKDLTVKGMDYYENS
jgi:hypothetical protein